MLKSFYEIDLIQSSATGSIIKRTKMTDVELQELMDQAYNAGKIRSNTPTEENLQLILEKDPQFTARLEEGAIVGGSEPAKVSLKKIIYGVGP